MKKHLLLLLLIFSEVNAQAQNYDLFVLPSITWDAPTSGGYLRISQMAACNYGPDNANEQFDVSLILKDVTTQTVYIIGTQTVQNPNIPQGNCTFIYDLNGYIADAIPTVPSGYYEWGVWVDSGEEIAEPDEANNFRYIGTINYPASLSLDLPNSKLDIKLYPNPTSDFIIVSGLLNGDMIKLLDMTGKEMYSSISNEKQNIIDTQNIKAGIYLLHVEKNGKSITKKLVISK